MQKISAAFSMPEKMAVKMKFNNTLDNTVKLKLAQQLIEELFVSDFIKIEQERHQSINGFYESVILFKATLLVHSH